MKYIFLLAVVFLCSCAEKSDLDPRTTTNLVDGDFRPIAHVEQLQGQTVAIITQSELIPWLRSHPTIQIHALTAIYRTTGYIIVWSDTVAHPVEKSAKDIALDKLTDADKKALGL